MSLSCLTTPFYTWQPFLPSHLQPGHLPGVDEFHLPGVDESFLHHMETLNQPDL